MFSYDSWTAYQYYHQSTRWPLQVWLSSILDSWGDRAASRKVSWTWDTLPSSPALRSCFCIWYRPCLWRPWSCPILLSCQSPWYLCHLLSLLLACLGTDGDCASSHCLLLSSLIFRELMRKYCHTALDFVFFACWSLSTWKSVSNNLCCMSHESPSSP